MVPRCLYPWSLAFLALMGLPVPSASSASIQFTGNVQNDFNPVTNPGVTITPVSSNPLNIGQSQWITNNGWISGWSIQDIRTSYDPKTDTLSVGVDNFKNANGQIAPFGQANGDPSGTPTAYDPAHLGSDKSFALAIAPVNAASLAQPGAAVAIAGIPADKTTAGPGIDGFTVAKFNAANASSGLAYQFGAALPQNTGNLAFDPSPSHPQLEFTIPNFSKIPGLNPSQGFWISAYAGSSLDGVAGEAYLAWSKVPVNAAQSIPEPATWLAWSLATGAIAWRLRRRVHGQS
jgi:hypothetical protein